MECLNDRVDLLLGLGGEEEMTVVDSVARELVSAIGHARGKAVVKHVSVLPFAQDGEFDAAAVGDGCLSGICY